MRRPSWTVILLVVGAALLAALIAAYLHAVRLQVHAYYEAELAPQRLGAPAGATPPPAARVTDVPWISSDVELSHSLSLQMLAAQQGVSEPRQKIDFLMGTTWGASELPRTLGFLPGQDPEVGFKNAAAALGFERHYLVTDEPAIYLRELKAQLASGHAVRAAVDLITLEGGPDALSRDAAAAHSIVLVGYDEAGFEYYEPVCRESRPCTPGTLPPGAKGLTIASKQLLDAVDRQAVAFKYPWAYQLLVLKKGEPPRAEELERALRRNALALVGLKRSELTTGAETIDGMAKAVSRTGRESFFTRRLERDLKLAAMVRRDDARVLPLLFPGDPRAALAATHLEASADAFGRAAATFEDKKNIFALNDALMVAAAADRRAGDALLASAPDAGMVP